MEKGKISSLQMAFMMYPAIVATIIISVPSLTATYANNDLWLSPILSSFIGYVTVYVVYQLHKLNPNQTAIQFSEQIIGRIAGKMVGFIILFFYMQTTGQILREYSELLTTMFLLQTPINIIMISMIFLCALVVRGGLEVLGRVAQVFFPAFIVPFLIFIPLLGPEYEFKNIFPILAEGIVPPIKGAIITNTWFSEFFLMTFFLPFLSDVKNGQKVGMLTVFSVTTTLVTVNLAVLFILGSTTSTKAYPLMIASRYVSIADFLENMESVAMAVWILGAFVKLSVFFYIVTLGTAQWLNLSDYRPLVWPLAIIFVEFSFWSMPSSMALNRYLISGVFFNTLVQTVIPLFLLVVAVIKKKIVRNQNDQKHQG